ncbi:superoxide dismutase family protein [Zunongwangia sp.]|uniref:superoxide dismutase family protein n=1 Tax=Zunongwangia sp. TaxID=1965325 RepID=UPI003AA90FD2
MKRISLTLIFLACIFASSCKNKSNKSENLKEEKTKTVTVNLEPKNDSNLSGTVVFSQKNGKVTMHATVKGIPDGKHAIHIHQKADCSSADGKSAGGHWNPTNQPHGKWGSKSGYHKGDIGNFEVDSNGNGSITLTTDEWCIGCKDTTKDILGKAIIIDDGVDDFTNQPSGAAGIRIGCGVIKM